jgi:8-oxo-dGTP diphosphatase
VSKPLLQIALALVHRDARWLVARRRADAHLGGLWEFPGGKCQRDEEPVVAAVRELREECRVWAIAERTLASVPCEYADRHVNLTPVLCRWVAGEARPLENEVCRWVTLAELRQLAMPPVNAEIIRQLEQAL